MRYWIFLRKPHPKVLISHLVIFFLSFTIGPLLSLILSFFLHTAPDDPVIYVLFYVFPTLFSGFLVLAGGINLLFYIKRVLSKNEKTQTLIPSGLFILLLILVLGIIYFFLPNISSSGGLCEGCEVKRCECFGFESFDDILSGNSRCVGVIYNCSTTIFHL
jgi:hypothetical protein